MGVASLVTTSDGDHLDNPRRLKASAGRLAAAQRALTLKKGVQAAPQGGGESGGAAREGPASALGRRAQGRPGTGPGV
ncbi:hypothetical protein [Microbispora sp. GKU 823]|uniref:hypothetical protein n=1 Tax=Microbispora sp. GKU 823 TaxID=1652100 RepID=UPI0021198486|nr:hypothetical protein [Microbispora sp. GKU 823]